MIKPNTENSNNSKAPLGELASNTRLIIPNTTPTTSKKYPEVTANKDIQQANSKEKDLTVFHNHSDWLTVNFKGLTEEQFQGLICTTGRGLATLDQGKPFSSGEKAKSYQNSISSPIGLTGAYNSYKLENSIDSHYDVTISLSGEYFAPLSAIQQQELYRDLHYRYSASCSRTDTSIDDYSFKMIPLDKMIEAYKQDNYFYFKDYGNNQEYTSPDNFTTTHYFGAKGSKKLVRVYEHKKDSLRLETQFRGEYAQVAFKAIATLEREDETDEEWEKIVQRTIGGLAIGTIDFRDRSKLKDPKKASKSKTKRLSFWQDFIDKIGVIYLVKIPKPKLDMSSHQASFNWLEKYASKTLAKAFHIVGKDGFTSYINRLIKLGESKFTPQDEMQIKYLRDNLEHLDFD